MMGRLKCNLKLAVVVTFCNSQTKYAILLMPRDQLLVGFTGRSFSEA